MIGYGWKSKSIQLFFDILNQVGVYEKTVESEKFISTLSTYISQASSNHYLGFVKNEFGEEVLDYIDTEDIQNYYYDMGLETSEKYLSWFNDFSETLGYFGSVDEEIEDDMLGRHCWWDYEHWYKENEDFYGNEVIGPYEKLEETNDFFWFLVLCIKRFGSFVNFDLYKIQKRILEVYEKDKSIFDWSIFEPLNVWIKRKMLEENYRKLSLKSISNELKTLDVDFSLIKSVDLNEIPEFELEENYIFYDNEYYEKEDVLRAITASGGFAQSLERQDLEPRVTTVNSLIKKKKKIKVKKDENRKY